MKTPKTVKKIDSNIWKRKKTWIVIGTIVLVVVTLITIASLTMYYTTIPKAPKSDAIPISTPKKYFASVYQSLEGGKDISSVVKTTDINWLWDTAPQAMIDKFPLAKNLSFSWPPPKGTRYKMTAFPYPDTGKSKFWLLEFAKGMESLLDNTADQVTFPGWQISIYEPMNPNYNSWQSFLSKDPKNPIDEYGIQTNPIYMEVTHSCYAPPKKDYPTCDDGGYWLYGTNGSGVFWSSCGTNGKTGKCMVANNKIDAIFKLWRLAQKTGNDGALSLAILATSGKGIKLTSTPEEYMAARLDGTGGGLKLLKALKTIISAANKHDQIPDITAWRGMEPSTSTRSWVGWIITIMSLLIVLIACLAAVVYATVIAIKNHGKTVWWKPTLVILGLIACLVGVAVLFWFLGWNVSSESLFEKFGYTTLDMAVKKSGMNVNDFLFSCAGLGKDYKNLPSGTYNPITNGLAQTQEFDFDLSFMASVLGIDSVIMHTQPNKSGSWAVEILDVRNTPVDINKTKSLDDLIFKLGMCGRPIDKGVKDNMPPLKQGPLEITPGVYFGYQPTAMCNCDEPEVSTAYKSGKGLAKCVFCKNSMSEQLCVPDAS
jgi:hypothetical protein